MTIELNTGVQILLDTVSDNLRHEDYKHVCDLADDYMVYVTGQGFEKKLKMFNPRESKEMYEQRIALTQITTPDIAGGCIKPMYKVGRTAAGKSITWKDLSTTEKNKKILEDAAKMFYGEHSVDEYLTYRQVDLDSTDPNAFIVVEFRTETGDGVVDPANKNSKAIPYPFEVSSKEAINYIYQNGVLQWLVVENTVVMETKTKPKVGEKYILYLDNNSVVMTQIDKTVVEDWKVENNPIAIDSISSDKAPLKEGVTYFFETPKKSDKRYFMVQVFAHNIGFNPARRVGIIPDLRTRKRTCVPLIHQAQPYFEKSIKTISEFDLTNCLHVFPQKIQYSDPCPGYQEPIETRDQALHNNTPSGERMYNLIGCNRGYTPNGQACRACHGTGFKYHQSAQDMLQIRMPKELSELVSLENVLVYKSPPIDLLEFQKNLGLFEYRYFAQKAVYNSENFSKKDIQKTATESTLDLDSVYDTLKPFADNYSAMWRHIMKCIAELRDIAKDMEIIHIFPTDFKMKASADLMDELTKASACGAASHIKKALSLDITNKLYVDKPEEILKITTKEKFNPFSGKTENEINMIIANTLCSKYALVLYANFDQIFADIEFDTAQKVVPNPIQNKSVEPTLEINFYQMEEKMQRDLVRAKVAEYQLAIDTEDAATAATAFKGATPTSGKVTFGPDGVTPVDSAGNPIDLTMFNPDGTPLNPLTTPTAPNAPTIAPSPVL